MEFIVTARSNEELGTEYRTLKEHGLYISTEINSGDGTPKDPFHTRAWVRNDNRTMWSGVIHIELQWDKVNPLYFMPEFKHGEKSGCECLEYVPNEFQLPSAPWRVVRGDKLSQPVVLVYDTGRIYGLSASPYFIYGNGIKVQWEPETEGLFYQYGGFSYSLSEGTIGYTLGYEHSIASHQVNDRAQQNGYWFELEPGETVTFTMDLFEFDAISELDMNDVIQEVYYNYQQFPTRGSNFGHQTGGE